MTRLLPSTPDLSRFEASGPRVIGIDGDEADELLTAMSSETARELLSALHEQPAAASDLAESVGTSLQNAQYHLGRLEEAGAVEVIDTVYSEKGREMKVYGPTDRPLVVVAGTEEETVGLQAAVMNLLGAVGLLGLASLVVQILLDDAVPGGAGGAQSGGGDGAFTVQDIGTPTPAAAPSGTGLPDVLLEPGVVFFAGGLLVLALVFTVWFRRQS